MVKSSDKEDKGGVYEKWKLKKCEMDNFSFSGNFDSFGNFLNLARVRLKVKMRRKIKKIRFIFCMALGFQM